MKNIHPSSALLLFMPLPAASDNLLIIPDGTGDFPSIVQGVIPQAMATLWGGQRNLHRLPEQAHRPEGQSDICRNAGHSGSVLDESPSTCLLRGWRAPGRHRLGADRQSDVSPCYMFEHSFVFQDFERSAALARPTR